MKYFTFNQLNDKKTITINTSRIRTIELNHESGVARIEMTGYPYFYYLTDKETHDRLVQVLSERK